ncbi:MAG: M14 family metallopeptidase [Gammaproteobacteria bacterium]
MLKHFHELPAGFLEVAPERLEAMLGGPALIELPGRRPEPLFVSIMLHGNEPTGLYAVQNLLRRHAGRELPRALSVFVGNVAAAARNLRRLDGQPDYNRVWPIDGQPADDSAESALMFEIVEHMRRRAVFASIDVHNNTGLNPHYGCVNRLDHRYLNLAAMFSRIGVYFVRPRGVCSMAMGALAPSTIIECGKASQVQGTEHVADFLDAALHLDHHPEHPVRSGDLDLYHTVATVTVAPDASFGFGKVEADLCLDPELERLNFRELQSGTAFGRVCSGDSLPVRVLDERGVDVAARYFTIERDELCLAQAVMPSMLTLDERVIRQDCLCYLMERIDTSGAGPD